MNNDSLPPNEQGHPIFGYGDSILVEERDTDFELNPKWTPATLLASMRSRLNYYGAPLPDGFVAPPGIDLDALLKQVPWPPVGSDDSAKG